MESLHKGTESLIAVESNIDDASSDINPTVDQYFLLHFIMGTYFAPDLKDEPRKSILQRRAEGLPPYNSDQLAGSQIKTVEVERIYYYILRNADRSVVVKLPLLQHFLHGNLPDSDYPQFDALFPPRLHPHSRFKDQYNVIENIAFINAPEIYYVTPEDIEKFKGLTRLEHLDLDEKAARVHTLVDGEALYNVEVQVESKCLNHPETINIAQNSEMTLMCSSTAPSPTNSRSVDYSEQSMLFLPAHPSKEEWSNIVAATKSGYALTGTAATGQIGPVLGLLDIGESDDSYLFRVSLPGVKRDEKDFSCEVENDGKVLIRGVTANGEKTVHKYSQVFEMQSQYLCPPGPFSISFKLPGPVNPQQFSGNFGTDGILEGIVMKACHERR